MLFCKIFKTTATVTTTTTITTMSDFVSQRIIV
jgi:hypothetical protein